jgi:hypothetical protein
MVSIFIVSGFFKAELRLFISTVFAGGGRPFGKEAHDLCINGYLFQAFVSQDKNCLETVPAVPAIDQS